jgi:hypothetical protein
LVDICGAVAGERANFGNELLRQRPDGGFTPFLAAGLGNVIAGPAGQRFNGHSGAALGEGAAHDYRHGVVTGAQFAQRDQAVHHRHFDIEQNQVGTL